VIHAVKIMHALFIEIEQLRGAEHFGPFDEFIIIGDVRFYHEGRIIDYPVEDHH
jgi:hypothetical protein